MPALLGTFIHPLSRYPRDMGTGQGPIVTIVATAAFAGAYSLLRHHFILSAISGIVQVRGSSRPDLITCRLTSGICMSDIISEWSVTLKEPCQISG